MKYWEDAFDDESAASYMANYGEGPGFVLRHEIGNLINGGESVLDVGCGPGWNFDHFKEHGPEVTYRGLDSSKRFVKVANQRNPGIYGVGDVRDIPEARRSWDVVILQDVLEHTNGYEKPIKEALRVAKRSVIITFWHLTENDDHINDDGEDTWGAWYSRVNFEKFLDSLKLLWLHKIVETPRKRDIYVIDKVVI